MKKLNNQKQSLIIKTLQLSKKKYGTLAILLTIVAIGLLVVVSKPRVEAKRLTEKEPALSGGPAFRYLKQTGEYGSLREAFEITRSDNGGGTDWLFAQTNKITAFDGAANDWFGVSVAISGGTAIVGADFDDSGATDQGSAYVFVRNGGLWTFQQKLTSSDGVAGDLFGRSVAIDGDTAVVTAFYDDNQRGSAYVFVRSGTTWTQQAKLVASDGVAGDFAGHCVAISGNTVILGASGDDIISVDQGSAYVFVRSGTIWTQQQKLFVDDNPDNFGISVAIEGDTALIGAPRDDVTMGDQGTARVFVRNGTTWTQQATFVPSDAAAGDWLGITVALSGNTAIVGAYFDDFPDGSKKGSAYIFVRNGTVWTQQAKLVASDGIAGDLFGIGVALLNNTAVVGAAGSDGGTSNSPGMAYVFTRSGTNWSQQQKLTANDSAPADEFGYSVAISLRTIIVGAFLDDIGAINQGSAYTFENPVRQFDFEGDAKADISLFRPSNATWYWIRSQDGAFISYAFGSSTDLIAPGDFDGDGKTDYAVFTPSSGVWSILPSSSGQLVTVTYGLNGDLPRPGDFDGDGKTDSAVFRPSNSTWYIKKSSGGEVAQQFGLAGDIPVVSDYDGDGKADIAIYRPSVGEWWIQRSTAGTIAYQFGNSSDKPVPGDYTSDGKADVAIWRPSTGEWFILRSENVSYYSFPFGLNGDIPAPADYDGDGKFDAAVFRPSTGVWYIERTTAGTFSQSFGTAGDKPVPGAFVP